jgi:hypothetical protein
MSKTKLFIVSNYVYDGEYAIQFDNYIDVDLMGFLSEVTTNQIYAIAMEYGCQIHPNTALTLISFKSKMQAEQCVEKLNSLLILNKLSMEGQ